MGYRTPANRQEDPKGKYTSHRKGQERSENTDEKTLPPPSFIGSTKLEAAKVLRDALSVANIEAVPVIKGAWCNWDLKTPQKIDIDGLEKDPLVLKSLYPARGGDIKIVEDAVKAIKPQKGKLLNAQLASLIDSLLADQATSNTTLSKLNAPRAGEHADMRSTHSWNGELLADRAVPQRDWFPESLKNLELERLFGFFPANEAQAFGLFLGRVMAGARTDKTVEGIPIDHFFRQLTVVCGPPGMGKSYLWSLIEDALGKLGYSVKPWDIHNSRFGLIPTAVCDAAVQGDVRDLTEVLKFPRLKHMITGGPDRLESKGVDHQDVVVRSTFLAFTNTIDLGKEVEPGILDRLTILHTKNAHELRQSGTRPRELWHNLSEQFGVSLEILALWGLRLSFELFMKKCGYLMDDSGHVTGEKSKDQLEEYTNTLKESCTVVYSHNHVGSLVKAVGRLFCVHLLKLSPAEREEKLEKAQRVGFSLAHLYPLLTLVVTIKDWRDQQLLPFAPMDLDMTMTKSLENALSAYDARVANLPPAKVFESYTEHLSSQAGLAFPSNRQPYHLHWKSYLAGAIDQWLPEIENIRNSVGIPEIISRLATDLGSEIERASKLVP